MHFYQTWCHWVRNRHLHNVTQRKLYRNELLFVDVTRGLLLMHKLWRITHKLSIAQKGFMSSFWMICQLTHRWRPQKQFIPYNPNFVAKMVSSQYLTFFGACGRKIVPRFPHRKLLKRKKNISTKHIVEKRQNGSNLQYYKVTSLF